MCRRVNVRLCACATLRPDPPSELTEAISPSLGFGASVTVLRWLSRTLGLPCLPMSPHLIDISEDET